MDNYKLYANLIRKPDSSDFNARPCVVEKWIPLSHWSFEQVKQDPLHDLEAVKAYRDIMFCDNEANHCIMLLDDCGKLYVSFYGAPNWSMKTEEEMDIPDNEVQSLDDGDISM